MVLWALEKGLGGEIFVPKIPSYRITDVAEAIAPGITPTTVGMRPGEKLHETMITSSDSAQTIDLGPYYAILTSPDQLTLQRYKSQGAGSSVADGFSYDSQTNPDFLSIPQIRQLITEQIDPNFTPI